MWGAESPAPTVTPRPSCTAALHGKMWPEEANADRNLAIQLAREGKLMICNHGPWRYHWEAPTVHIRELKERAQKRKNNAPLENRPAS